jgi:Holliday junction resolvase-like predicted endonuclease
MVDEQRLQHLRCDSAHALQICRCDSREVDLVLERRDGSVVAVEVKTSASASSSDFAVSGT